MDFDLCLLGVSKDDVGRCISNDSRYTSNTESGCQYKRYVSKETSFMVRKIRLWLMKRLNSLLDVSYSGYVRFLFPINGSEPSFSTLRSVVEFLAVSRHCYHSSTALK